jgi:hypothetical protein
LELSTVALGIVYFEKLVFKGVVTKPNRKLIMSACLVLAFKFNEEPSADEQGVQALLDDIQQVQSLAPKQVLNAEFAVFAHLHFRLKVKESEWMPQFNHLVKVS